MRKQLGLSEFTRESWRVYARINLRKIQDFERVLEPVERMETRRLIENARNALQEIAGKGEPRLDRRANDALVNLK